MALADYTESSRMREFLRTRVREWLAGEHVLMRRMAGIAVIIRVSSSALVFLSQIFLARWMGSYEFGTFVYVWTWLLLLGDIVPLGVPITAQRFIPEYTQGGKFDLLRGYLAGSRWIAFALGTGVAILGAAVIWLSGAALDRHLIVPLYFACIALPFYALAFMLDSLARTYDWVNLALVPTYLLRPLTLVVVMAVAHFTGLATDAATAMGAVAFGTWLNALIQLFLLDRRLAHKVPPGPKAYNVRLWFVTSLPIVAVWGLYTLLIYTDVLVLKQFRPADEVAHYYAASKTLALVSIVYFSVAMAAAHHFTAYYVSGDRAGLAAFAAGSVRWIFWPSIAVTVLLLALGKPILMLFGQNFVAAYPVMFVLAIGLLARASVGPAERMLNMLGQQRLCALAYAAAFAVNITGCLLLAAPFGGMGVASATAGAFVVESTLLFLIARHRLGLHMFIWPRRQLASAHS